MLDQIWKAVTIQPYSTRYKVSNYGRVMNSQTQKIIKAYRNNKGYYIVDLCWQGVYKHMLVSRLVAMAFIQNPQNKPNVDHIDTDITNNCVQNLRWCTQSQNLANPISRLKLNKALKAAKNTVQGRQRNRQAQLKCQNTPEAKARSMRTHRHQMKCYRCLETGVVYFGGHAAQRQLGLRRGYVLKSAKDRKAGKPMIEERGGRKILHFQFVQRQFKQ